MLLFARSHTMVACTCALLLLAGAIVATTLGARSTVAGVTPNSFFMVQLTDPQFGQQHGCRTGVEPGCAAGWSNEEEMLNESIRLVNRLRPRFAVLTGDMQHTLPNSNHQIDERQATAAQRALSLLDPSIPLRATIPGNHDLGNRPTLATLQAYRSRWDADRTTFEMGGVRFIALDSQLYVDASAPGIRERAAEQTRWLSLQLDAAVTSSAAAAAATSPVATSPVASSSVASSSQGASAVSGIAAPAGVVLLTHVPPFVVRADEAASWANWGVAARQQVLSMSQRKAVPPSLVVAGHFHANVEAVHSDAFGAPIEVVTSSAVGCAIAWNGSHATAFPHTLAAAIAAVPTGLEAVRRFILRNGSMTAPADASLLSSRVVAARSVSGARLFEFSAATGYRHRFYSLSELGALRAPLASGAASPLADIAFTPWVRR